jgi:hypothetical protein
LKKKAISPGGSEDEDENDLLGTVSIPTRIYKDNNLKPATKVPREVINIDWLGEQRKIRDQEEKEEFQTSMSEASPRKK